MNASLDNLDAAALAEMPVADVVDFVKQALTEIRDLTAANATATAGLQTQATQIDGLNAKIAGLEGDKVELEKVASAIVPKDFKLNEVKLTEARARLGATGLINPEEIKVAKEIISKDAHAMLGLVNNVAAAALNIEEDGEPHGEASPELAKHASSAIPAMSEWIEKS